jgi:hypothetical protein
MLLTVSALHHYVVFSLGFIAMAKTKGAKDKRVRKRRGGDRPVTAVTPLFASSNNRRGSATTQQRFFAAHFQDVSSVGQSEGVSAAHFQDVSSVGLSEGVTVSMVPSKSSRLR